jgi:hypothetical protein
MTSTKKNHTLLEGTDRIALKPKQYYDAQSTGFSLAVWLDLVRERTPPPDVVFDGVRYPSTGSYRP